MDDHEVSALLRDAAAASVPVNAADNVLQRLADAMPTGESATVDGLDVLVAAAWGACLGVCVVHVSKALLRGLSRLRSAT